MNDSAQNPQVLPSDDKAHELQKAFSVFNQISLELTQTYQALQAQVASLTEELAIANGELRRQYQEKEALSERLSLLLNALPAGVVVLNDEACISEINPAAEAMLGQSILGDNWAKLQPKLMQATDSPNEWQLGDVRIAMQESALDSAGGKILLLHDITSAHTLKNDLERNKRLAAMGEMAASLAHQLRTPLATALLYSANLSQPDISTSARTRFAEKATAQLQRLERLIQDVLLFARGESIGRERIHCHNLIREVSQTLEPLCREKNVVFSTQSTLGSLEITGSRKALSGALLNLLENALHACENKGSAGQITLQAKVYDGKIRIQVSDTGNGIPPEAQVRIFEPFFTTRGQGTGLGLAIALGVARAHGGNIEVNSRQGEGSDFTLTLPAQQIDIGGEI